VLAIMQHHHAPTRMIDFSRSPLVALYFAVVSLAPTDGRIFVIDSESLLEEWTKEATRVGRDPQSYQVLREPTSFQQKQEENLAIQADEVVALPLPYVPSSASDRMRAQSGFFLAEPLSTDWLDRAGDLGYIASLEIPHAIKLDLLRIVLRTNNGGGTLFPGLDGVGTEIVERHLAEEQLGLGWDT